MRRRTQTTTSTEESIETLTNGAGDALEVEMRPKPKETADFKQLWQQPLSDLKRRAKRIGISDDTDDKAELIYFILRASARTNPAANTLGVCWKSYLTGGASCADTRTCRA
jgi:hypothetical protein